MVQASPLSLSTLAQFKLCPESPSWLAVKKSGRHLTNTASNGYFIRMSCGKQVLLHRAVFTLAYGYDPYPLVVDHVDENRQNNHPANLRPVTSKQNTLFSKHNPAELNDWLRSEESADLKAFGKFAKQHLPELLSELGESITLGGDAANTSL